VAGWFIIPQFMRLNVASGYELLERRLGVAVRQLGVCMYLSMRLMWMGLILYGTVDKVVVPMTGIKTIALPMTDIVVSATPLICTLLAAITIVYTTMGGLKAIVAIDAAQSFLLFGGVVLSLVLITQYVGGVGAWWPREWNAHWVEPNWIFADASGRSIIGSFCSVFLWYICTAGSDQMAIQRYFATRDASAARRMLGVSLIASFTIQSMLCCLGFALLTYALANPDFVPEGSTAFGDADQLFPKFIMTVLPRGVSGLVIAGLLAEAMNSLSSGMSAASTVVVTDLVGRFRQGTSTPEADVRLARWASVLVGVLVIALSMFMINVEGNLFDRSFKVVNLLVAPLFGLFFMALFVRWGTSLGTLVGAVCGVIIAIAINFWKEITGETPPIGYLFTMPLSLTVQVAVGSLVSLLPIGIRNGSRDPEGWKAIDAEAHPAALRDAT
jgi:SSS family solute:Na+ symporter